MEKYKVAIGKYRKKLKSLRRIVELSELFKGITGDEKVFIKPNIVYWSPVPDYPKYGVVTFKGNRRYYYLIKRTWCR